MALTALLAALGAVAVAAGAALMFLPAGLIVGGVEAVCAAYVAAYLTHPKPPKGGSPAKRS